MAELARVPQDAVRAFSTRRESLGTHGFAAARVAALATREAQEQAGLRGTQRASCSRSSARPSSSRSPDATSTPRAQLRGRVLLDEGVELSEEQRRLVREATMNSDRVVCVVGAAGAGKTTALRAVND